MKPPSMTSSAPVTKEASSDARNNTPLATSTGSPSRRSGVSAILSAAADGERADRKAGSAGHVSLKLNGAEVVVADNLTRPEE